jgi:outer membrane protein assembly factor BamA
MRLASAIVALGLLVATGTPAAPVDFDITGNSELSDEAILEEIRRIDCSAVDSACIDSVCHAVAGYYWWSGYLDAEVQCKRSVQSDGTVEIAVSEGRLSVLKAVSINGAAARDTSTLEGLFSEQIGRPFSQAALEEGISAVLGFYDGRGYPLTRIRPEMVSAGVGWVGVRLHVTAGPRADVGCIVFNGMTKTRRNAVLAESGLVEGLKAVLSRDRHMMARRSKR